MTAQHWLSTWESMTMHALNGCVGVPTVVFSSKHLKSDMFYSVDYLYKALTNAGTLHRSSSHPNARACGFSLCGTVMYLP